MNKTYLINPSERAILTNAGDRMPLGLLYIAGYLNRFGENVKVVDMNHDNVLTLTDMLNRDKPQVVGVSCLTSPMVPYAKSVINVVKEVSPKSKIVVGGYHPTIMPQDFQEADYVIKGEGEKAMLDIIRKNVDGPIVSRMPLDAMQLGIPARYLLDNQRYNMKMGDKRASTMITSRGCPNSCKFCGNMNKKVRYNSLEDVEAELRNIRNDNYNAVYFLDDVFTIDKDRARIIGEMARRAGLSYRCTTRANYVNDKLAKNLADTGCDIVSMGVESGVDYILENIGKNQSIKQIRNAVATLGQHGIKSKGFFIIGLPGETYKTANRTLDFADELRGLGMEYADFYPLTPFPGTEIWNNPSKYGIKILDKDYTKYLQASKDELGVYCETRGLNAKAIKEAVNEGKRRWKS